METTEFTMVREFSFDVSRQLIRSMIDKEGEPWFVAKDVCDILEITNSRKAIQNLDEDERDGVTFSDATGRNQEQNIINESGLYNLIFRSNKPQAKVFRKWVTSEVLPAIRKQGHFGIPLNLEIPEDSADAVDLWVYLGKHKQALVDRLKIVRDLEKKAAIQIKSGARPYHLPVDKQIGLFTAVQS